MSPKRQPLPVAASSRFGDRSGLRAHRHQSHQLSWAPHGAVTIGAAGATWVLAHQTALWIPAGTEHDVFATRDALMHSLYFDPDRCRVAWSTATAVHTSGVVGHLLDHLLDAPAGRARRRAELLVFDLLEPARTAILRVPRPTDDRVRRIADALHLDPGDPKTLTEWGQVVGASGRTLARLVARDTGMGFERWRTTVRIAHAAERLTAGEPVARVGTDVGYATPSAFVAAFRRVVGVPPGTYASTRRGRASDDVGGSAASLVPPGVVVQVRSDLVADE